MTKKFKYECYKIDKEKIDPKKSATWNVYYQFGIDLEKAVENGELYNYEDFLMPPNIQEEFIKEYMKVTKIKYYKQRGRKGIGLEILDFPVCQ